MRDLFAQRVIQLFRFIKYNQFQKAKAYIYIECKDLDLKVAGLIEKGIQFDEKPTDKPWLWREARLKDVDGNKLILFYGGENRRNPPWKIKT